MRAWLLILALLAVPASAETLTNASVVTLVQAGIGDEAVIAKVRASANSFALDTADILALKQKGVPGSVIAAMITANAAGPVSAKAASSADAADPRLPHPSGVYLLASWLPAPRMMRIDPTTANQTRTGGVFGYALTGGIASMSMKSVLSDATARVRAPIGRPDFYFYFDDANQSLSNGGGSTWLNAMPVTSPAEFSLVRFAVKDARREAKIGSFNIRGAKAGVMDKDRIAFDYDQVAPGVYHVSPRAALDRGEYGFIYSMRASSGAGLLAAGGITARVFDFSVGSGATIGPGSR